MKLHIQWVRFYRSFYHKKIKFSILSETSKKNNVKIGICGQAPSDFPDFAQFLIEEGIDTISLTPDSVVKTIKKWNFDNY